MLLDRWSEIRLSLIDGTLNATLPAATFPVASEWRDLLVASGVCAPLDGPAPRSHTTPLIIDGNRVALRRYAEAERRLARQVAQRLHATTEATGTDLAEPVQALFRTLFPAAATEVDWQAQAALAALRSPLTIVTGGPGTGKTTTAARILALLLAQDPSRAVAIAAPTGRAARRLKESMDDAVQREPALRVVLNQLPREGRTIHQLLGYRPFDDRFRHNAEHPLAADVVLVDEASMIDVLMMDALFAAVKPTARLIILGDPDQLASVDTGYVLGDLVRAAEEPSTPLHEAVVRLRVSRRFGARPAIGALAEASRQGDVAAVHRAFAMYPDGSQIARIDSTASFSALLAPVQTALDAYLASNEPAEALDALGRFRLLTPLRGDGDGVAGLNARMERWLRLQERVITGWYSHRPVLITANDQETGLANGDVGVCLLGPDGPRIWFAGGDGTPRAFVPSQLPEHETAWAMTIHKSQGSEFDHVLVILPDTPSPIMSRELLYTGITRAKQSVTIAGPDSTLEATLAESASRDSALVDYLTEAWNGRG
jgi:exodeoxyribonuclease V alpha subunit